MNRVQSSLREHLQKPLHNYFLIFSLSISTPLIGQWFAGWLFVLGVDKGNGRSQETVGRIGTASSQHILYLLSLSIYIHIYIDSYIV